MLHGFGILANPSLPSFQTELIKAISGRSTKEAIFVRGRIYMRVIYTRPSNSVVAAVLDAAPVDVPAMALRFLPLETASNLSLGTPRDFEPIPPADSNAQSAVDG